MNLSINTEPKGFTLIEVLIAAVILAVGLLAVSTMIARSTIQDSRAYYLTKASMLIEEYIERESHKQYTQEFGNLTNSTSNINIDGTVYTRSCTISSDPNHTPEYFCKELTCRVDWNNKGTQGRTEYVYDFCKYVEP